MRIIIFKKKYEFPLLEGGKYTVDPVRRIKGRIKTTTIRVKNKPLGNYQVKQGGWYKNFIIHKDFYLNFWKKELKIIRDLSREEVRIDLGLTIGEFDTIVGRGDPVEFFLEGIQKMNPRYKIEIGNSMYFFSFNLIWTNDIPKMKSLESYFKGSGK